MPHASRPVDPVDLPHFRSPEADIKQKEQKLREKELSQLLRDQQQPFGYQMAWGSVLSLRWDQHIALIILGVSSTNHSTGGPQSPVKPQYLVSTSYPNLSRFVSAPAAVTLLCKGRSFLHGFNKPRQPSEQVLRLGSLTVSFSLPGCWRIRSGSCRRATGVELVDCRFRLFRALREGTGSCFHPLRPL